MNVEERSGYQPNPKKNESENQWERKSSHTHTQERKPIYQSSREAGALIQETARNASARRPRIKDSHRINYNRPQTSRPDDGNLRENVNRQSYSPFPEQSEKRSIQPHYPQRQAYSQSHSYMGEGNEKPRTDEYHTNRPKNPNASVKKTKGRKQGNTSDYNPNNKYSHRKQLKYKEALTDPNEPIRLNKFLANAGVCSRREADTYIQAGVVKVNDKVITELGTKISRMDTVMFHDQTVKIESKVYVLLNKPKNCLTTTDDPEERLTIMKLVKSACDERIYPIGRLDRNTTGVLLLTNDGNLAAKLTHPSFKKKKIYHVWLDKDVDIKDMEKIANGIELEDGEIHADAISYVNEEDKNQVGIEIHSGRNRIVRRMFEALGYHVTKLDRVYFAGLTKKNLPRGKWRYLNEMEVNALRMGSFE